MNRMHLVALCIAVSLGCFGMASGIELAGRQQGTRYLCQDGQARG